MKIDCLVTGAYQENCYILSNEQQEAVVVDPGENANEIIDFITHHGLSITAYLCTHAHADHISALHEVHTQFPAHIAMHTLDWNWAFDEINQSPPYYATPMQPDTETYLALETQPQWSIGSFEFEVIHTPGHTPGSCTLYFSADHIALVGDTLFKGSCGRTDLPGGNAVHLKESLKKLRNLPPETTALSGHGESTTIGHEINTNFYMR
ncbi:MAG: MBL fold metallo-hydrolase [Kiritimatiellaceae bacterium]|nr:MAG: MBL fold metallo-hydrolase [Kiritimatiellaceae bacterium]|tara:strand:+ start:4614 stop:5237 length:624 start_codon:yes stop_codon:yes gene_type:complete